MKLLVDPAALAELQDAAAFYRVHANVALGRALIDEFDRVAHVLLSNPNLGTIRWHGLYQYPLRRFPYYVIYQIAGDQLRIIAVAHQKRRPGYWRKRT